MIRTTMTRRWMGTATLAAAAGLVACASGKGMGGTYGGSSGAGGSAGAVNPPADSTASGATTPDTTSRAVPPTGAAKSRVGTGTSAGALPGGLTGESSGAAATPGAAGAAGTTILNLGSDAHIVSAIDIANTDEIAAGQLARERARDPRVRAFADKMVTDHGKLQAQDRALASNPAFIASDSAEVARTMRSQDEAALAKLREATPATFDALYITQQVDAHKKTLALLNAVRSQAQDPRLRDLINAAIPQVQAHLDLATALQQSLGTGAAGSSGPGR